MREFVFTLAYDSGTNAVADVLSTAPNTRIRSLSCHVSAEHLWRVDHITGSATARDDIVTAVTDGEYYPDCLARRDCEADWQTHVLDETGETLVVYSYWTRTPACASIPHLALEQFGDGLLFETTWTKRQYEWRLIVPGSPEFSAFHKDLTAEIAGTAGVEIRRITNSPPSPDHDTDERKPVLSSEQDAALRAAVDAGYYHTPREIEAYELADRLDIPGSTFTYRLRRAESRLALAYVDPIRSDTATDDGG
jgi:predicted DNA binding protein